MIASSLVIHTFSTFVLMLLVVLHQLPCVLSEVVVANLPTPTRANARNFVNQRQNVCNWYDKSINETSLTRYSDVANALSGMHLNVIITKNKFFEYSENTGIPRDSLVVNLLDELAIRANFTWRNSFAVTSGPENGKWDEALELYTEMFDVAVDYWDKSSYRLNRGIAFVDQWFDGNMILIEKIEPVDDTDGPNYTNFLKPFTLAVWLVALATVVASALIYQWLEWLNNERDDRTLWKWFEDNLYLSSMNFTQQYMHEPTSGGGRILGFSMAVWAMVMGATYTANLASLFVEEQGGPIKIQDIDDAIRREKKICTWNGTNADKYVRARYKRALFVPLKEEIDTYEGLHDGRCDVTVGAMSSWRGYEMDKDYNTFCDLEWVGRTIEEVSSSFAVKADPAEKCTNLIRDALNYHLAEMQRHDKLKELWDEHYLNHKSVDCSNYEPSADESGEDITDEGIRRLRASKCGKGQRRVLKGGGGGSGGGANPGAAAANGEEEESSSLSMKAMAGTFVLHAALSGLAILVGLLAYLRKRVRGSKDLLGAPEKMDGSLDASEETAPETSLGAKTASTSFGVSLAGGRTSLSSRRVNEMINHACVQDQLQALHGQQEKLAEQMALLVSMVAKDQEKEPDDLTQLALRGATIATDDSIRLKAKQLLREADKPNSTLENF